METPEGIFIEKTLKLGDKFETEAWGFDLLNRLPLDPGIIKVIRPLDVNRFRQSFRFNDVRGRSVEAILDDGRIPKKVKDRVTSAYVLAMRHLTEKMIEARQPPTLTLETNRDLPNVTIHVDEELIFSVRPSQVIVTFIDGKPDEFFLTIVDPY